MQALCCMQLRWMTSFAQQPTDGESEMVSTAHRESSATPPPAAWQCNALHTRRPKCWGSTAVSAVIYRLCPKTILSAMLPALWAAKNSCLCICHEKKLRKETLSVSGSAVKSQFFRLYISLSLSVMPFRCTISSWQYRAELKVTDLRWQSPICGFLRFSAKIWSFSAVSCALQILEFPGEGWNLRKSAAFFENLRFGLSLSLFSLRSCRSSSVISFWFLGRKFGGNLAGIFSDPQNKGSKLSAKISERLL